MPIPTLALTVLWLLMLPAFTFAQSFSCAIGKQPACLDYDDKVCSSFAKCVSDDAICFDSYTCDYKGFVCKSALEDVVDKYELLEDDYNRLVRKYNDLLEEGREIADTLENVRYELRTSQSNYSDLKRCVEGLGSGDDPSQCL